MRYRRLKESDKNFVKREMNKLKITYSQLADMSGVNYHTMRDAINALDSDRYYLLRRAETLWRLCETIRSYGKLEDPKYHLDMWAELSKTKNLY